MSIAQQRSKTQTPVFVSTEIEGSRCVATAHWLGPLLRSKQRHGIKKGAWESVYFYNRRWIESSFGRFAGRLKGRKWVKRPKKKIKRRRDAKKGGGQTHMSADWWKEIMRIGRGRKKERKMQTLSVATANGMCDTRVLLLHDEASLSPVIWELFCQSVISFCSLCRRTGRAVRTFALATYPWSSSDVSSLASGREEARLPRAQTRRTTSASITVASVRFTLAASLRETAGDKWLKRKLGLLNAKRF